MIVGNSSVQLVIADWTSQGSDPPKKMIIGGDSRKVPESCLTHLSQFMDVMYGKQMAISTKMNSTLIDSNNDCTNCTN